MNSSLGAIVLTRDEERCIGRCLDSVDAFGFDDVLVVDTGSVDGTLDVVRDHGIRIHRHAWSDSFAAARNAGLDAIGTDWVVFVDADEWLVEGSASTLKARLDPRTVAFAPRIVDVTRGSVVDRVPRVLPAGPRVRYRGRVHEYPVVDGAPVEVVGVDLELHHDGYAPEVLRAKDKHRRNLALLRRSLAEEPDDPRWPFYAVRDGVSVLAPDEIEELCERSARLAGSAEGQAYYQDTLVKACYAFTGHGRWPSVAKWCGDLADADAQYFHAVVAVLRGQVSPADLHRTAAVRETGAGTICPAGDHLDAATAVLVERLHGPEAADEFRELVVPWTDMFFQDSRLRT